uniref:LON peptidase substrate-binding domain-containing protein n=1 Tax=Thaumasiovibrio occultus TaxID=1891184 RepID=UPI000B358A6D|nr:LON peptidase substrate-binding domain-containing protein [Thaumasiovibrio occultus]
MQHYLFPLPVLLLPGGVTLLRIFEPRYLRLVKECCATDTGFVIAMEDNNRLCSLGTLVKITDFEQRDDNTLGITIKSLSVVQIDEPAQQDDGLWYASTERRPFWDEKPAVDETQFRNLSHMLRQLFVAYPDLDALYPVKLFDDVNWVCSRWLEVVPLANNQRQWYLGQADHAEALQFLTTTLIEDSTPTQHS